MFPFLSKLIPRATKAACLIKDEATRDAITNLANYISQTLGNSNSELDHEGQVRLRDIIVRGSVTQLGDTETSTFNGPVTHNGDVIFNGDTITMSTTIQQLLTVMPVQLTTAMSSGSASARFCIDSGGSYIPDGPTFTVYDPTKLAWNAFTGQQGWVKYDFERAQFIVCAMNAPLSRRGTISVALERYTSGATPVATFTDANNGAITFTVYGYFVMSGYKMPSSSTRVKAEWMQAENSGNGRWVGTLLDKCLVVV